MTKTAKILLAILIATLLGGGGYFYLKLAKKPPETVNKPSVVEEAKTEKINTSDWQTFRNETLGFEIKMPKEWVVKQEYLGRFDPDDDEFWQDQVGGARFIASMTNGFPQFNVRIKDSDLSLEEFLGDTWEKRVTINNLPTKIHILDFRNEPPNRRSYSEFVVSKNNNRYYYFEFSASIQNINQDVNLWDKILNTFKPIP